MQITNYQNTCGEIKNFLTADQLHDIFKIFRSIEHTSSLGNKCFGIDQKHKAYLWLKKVLIKQISDYFNPNLKLIFAMYLDCVQPFNLHHDLKDIPESNGKHYLSFLIPYSVNNDTNICNKVSTLIFNETFPHDYQIENNVSDIYEDKINHISKDLSYKISLKENLIWNFGSLFWWDSHLLHVSNNFVKDGYTSKQAIIIHTYVL